jgi:exosortase
LSSAPASLRAALGRLPGLAKANLVVLGAFGVLLCALLAPEWRGNPDLAHGWAMPVIFLLLLRESRQGGPARYLKAGPGPAAAVAILALAGLAVLSAAGLYAAAVDWTNALVEFLLATAFALLLGAGLAAAAGERQRLIPWNWSSWVAIGLWPLSAPIPPGLYTRLTLALQLWISTAVMDALALLGVAAHREGNIIELATTQVGVEEACSGVRSLVSCVFVACFFSASLVRRPWARAVVIAVAAPLALVMNFLRSLALTLLANDGVSIAGFWHDATGFAVLLVTGALLAGLALVLEDPLPRPAAAAIPPPSVSSAAGRLAPTFLAAALALAAVLVLLFELNTHPALRTDAPAPDLGALLPEAPAGWIASPLLHFDRFKSLLETDLLAQRNYEHGRGPSAVEISVYLAYWRPGQAPVSLVEEHTPDACWPGAGWLPQTAWKPDPRTFVSGRSLAPVESRLFLNQDAPRYVWFWHLYAGRRIPYHNPYSAGELLRLAWRYGFRHNGDQMFICVSSNRPWNEIADEPVVRAFFGRMQPLGL